MRLWHKDLASIFHQYVLLLFPSHVICFSAAQKPNYRRVWRVEHLFFISVIIHYPFSLVKRLTFVYQEEQKADYHFFCMLYYLICVQHKVTLILALNFPVSSAVMDLPEGKWSIRQSELNSMVLRAKWPCHCGLFWGLKLPTASRYKSSEDFQRSSLS